VDTVAAFHHEHYKQASGPQRAIDTVTGWIGRPATFISTLAVLAVWAAVAWKVGGRVDQPIFAWLEFAATVGALIIAMLVLVTQHREDELAERRAQLTLELALLADRRSAKIIALIEEFRRDIPNVADRLDPESAAMATPADPQTVAAAIESGLAEPHQGREKQGK
jgi:uncharacterized membrane protein